MDRTLKRSVVVGAAALAAAFVVFGALALIDQGYRMNGLRVISPGVVVLGHFPEGGKLRVDGQEFPREPHEGELRLSLVGGRTHHIIISREGFWPWEKEITAQGGEALSFNVFLMPVSPVGVPVLKNPERKELEAAFAEATIPTRAHPAVSSDGRAVLFSENGSVVTTWRGEDASPQYYCLNDADCKEHIAISFDAQLRDLAFYPGRSDIALLAIQNGIFALELDNRGTQNFQPVYRGTRPRLFVIDGVAYLQEGLAVLKLSL